MSIFFPSLFSKSNRRRKPKAVIQRAAFETLEDRRLMTAVLVVGDSSGVATDKTINFPNTALGATTANQTFTLTNTGNTSLTILGLAEAGANQADFTITVKDNLGNVVATPDFSIAAGKAYSITTTMTPTLLAAETATIGFQTNDPQNATVTLTMNGTGVQDQLVVTDTQGATMDEAVAFNDTAIGFGSETETFTLTNTSTTTALNITNIFKGGTNPGDFDVQVFDNNGNAVNAASFAIAANTSFTVNATMFPSLVGAESATIGFGSSDPQNANVTLNMSGNGTAAVNPTATLVLTDSSGDPNDGAVAFADTPLGGLTNFQSFYIDNQGATALNVTNLAAGGANPADFPITVEDQYGTVIAGNHFTVPVGRTYTINVAFQPTIVGAESDTMTFNTNDAGNATVNLTASGNGTPAAIPAAPTNLVVTPIAYNELDLTWTDNSTNETGFKIYRSTAANGTFTLVGTVGKNVTAFNDVNDGLIANTPYFYELQSFNNLGDSATIAAGTGTTLAPPADKAGNTYLTAKNIGKLGGQYVVNDYVGDNDVADWYKIITTHSGLFTAIMTPTGGDADMRLLKSNGAKIKPTVLVTSELSGTQTETISRNLPSGVYYIKVYRGLVGQNATYKLTLRSDYGGNTLETADWIKNANLHIKKEIEDWVGPQDTIDLFKIVLKRTELTVKLYPRTENADLYLLNSTGVVLQQSTKVGTATDTINSTLKPGTYYIEVLPAPNMATNYKMTIDTLEGPPNPT